MKQPNQKARNYIGLHFKKLFKKCKPIKIFQTEIYSSCFKKRNIQLQYCKEVEKMSAFGQFY